MARAGYSGRAVTLFPWLAAGEVHRIRGFFEAKREGGGREPLTPTLSPEG
jgi:hypothetical protein